MNIIRRHTDKHEALSTKKKISSNSTNSMFQKLSGCSGLLQGKSLPKLEVQEESKFSSNDKPGSHVTDKYLFKRELP